MLTIPGARSRDETDTFKAQLTSFSRPGNRLPLSVREIVRVSKFAGVFPVFRGLSLAANAAADLRRLMPTMATEGGRSSNTIGDWLIRSEAGSAMFS